MSHFSRSRCSQMNDYFPINFFIRSTTSLGCGTTSYDETTRRLKKDLRANSDSIRFHLDMAALDDPRLAAATRTAPFRHHLGTAEHTLVARVENDRQEVPARLAAAGATQSLHPVTDSYPERRGRNLGRREVSRP